MQTNKLVFKTNFDELNSLFVFLCFEWIGKFEWANSQHLDKLLSEQRAEACLYRYGQFAYALFKRKNVNNPESLRQKIASLPEFNQIKVSLVQATEQGKDNVITGTWLYQLLLNALINSPIESLAFHNLNGECFLIPQPLKKRDSFIAYQLVIDKSDIFRIQAVTFRQKFSILKDPLDKTRQAILNRPTYTIEMNTLKRDFSHNNHSYIKAGERGTHNSSEAINISTLNKFKQSRLGILHLMKEKYNRYYDGISQLSWFERKVEQKIDSRFRLLNEGSNESKKLIKLLQGMQIALIDKIQTNESHNLIQDIQQQLSNIGFPSKLVNSEQKNISHLCLIKSSDKYQDGEDPYQQDSYIRQHLSDSLYLDYYQEDMEKGACKRVVLLKNLLKEMWIKADVQQKKISLFETQHVLSGQWIFGTISSDAESIIDLLVLKHTGEIAYFRDTLLCPSIYHADLQDVRDWIEENKSRVESFIISNRGDINLIIRTNEIVLPKLDLIYKEIMDVDMPLPPKYQDAKKVAMELESAHIDKSETLISILNQFSEPLTKRTLTKLLRQYARGNKAVRAYLRTLGIVLSFSKTNVHLAEKMGDLFSINGGVIDEKTAWYSVGGYVDGLQQHLPHFIHLREIIALKGENRYIDILPLLDVDFVRFKGNTVQPFPLKYLREMKACTKLR